MYMDPIRVYPPDRFYRDQNTPLSLVVNLDVPDEVILGRISDRWVHLPSGRVYNMSYNRPKVDGFDDATGEPLTKRPDDRPVGCSLHMMPTHEAHVPCHAGNLFTPLTTVLCLYVAPRLVLCFESQVCPSRHFAR